MRRGDVESLVRRRLVAVGLVCGALLVVVSGCSRGGPVGSQRRDRIQPPISTETTLRPQPPSKGVEYVSRRKTALEYVFALAIDKDDVLWWISRGVVNVAHLFSYDTRTGATRSYRLPSKLSYGGVATDRAGHVWVGMSQTLVRLTASTGRLKAYRIPRARFQVVNAPTNPAQSIIADFRGRLWISRSGGRCLTRFDPKTEVFDDIELPRSFGAAAQLATNAAGRRIWMTNGDNRDRRLGHGRLAGRFDVVSSEFVQVPLRTYLRSFGPITVTPGGDLVYADFWTAGRVRRLDSSTLRSHPEPQFDRVRNVVALLASRAGRLWAAPPGKIKLTKPGATGLVSFKLGTFVFEPYPPGPHVPFGVSTAPQLVGRSARLLVEDSAENLWFTAGEFNGDRIGVIRLERVRVQR